MKASRLHLAAFAIATFAANSPARAGAMHEYSGFRWDSDQAGVITSSSSSDPSPSPGTTFNTPKSGFLADDPSFDPGTTAGRQLGGPGPYARAATLGSSDFRNIFTYSFSNPIFNSPGADDFVVFEQGFPDQPEGFMVRVQAADGSFSGWRYEFFDTQQPYSDGIIGVAYGTGFNLEDFGFTPGTSIVGLEIANLLATDRVSGADGQGFVRFLGDSLYGSSYTPIDPSRGQAFRDDQFDPDILYVTGLATPVPEPATWVVLTAGGAFFALASRRRRRA